uniref:Ig-like domain-containing protein n=1 Tax=Zosterops lateralis melanops TaxID=1220523 RepID=A0A8D2PSB9_ZOSLA
MIPNEQHGASSSALHSQTPALAGRETSEPQIIQYLLTSQFANISSAEVSSMALIGDIPILTLDSANWSIHFYWPWVSQPDPTSCQPCPTHSWDLSTGFALTDPLVVQFRAGCVLYPNTTSQGFLNVGWRGKDLVAFEVDKQHWEAQQPSQVAELVSKSLNKNKSVRVLLKHLLSIWVCQSNFPTLKRYGREILERQELPVATVFTRSPRLDQLLLVCHVTGFYPRPISVAWLRDGQEVPPGPVLNSSPILPKADLTHQLCSVLAVAPRDGHSYVCRVRHQSLGTRSLLIPWGRCHPWGLGLQTSPDACGSCVSHPSFPSGTFLRKPFNALQRLDIAARNSSFSCTLVGLHLTYQEKPVL